MRNIRMNDYKRRWDNKNRRWIYDHREVAGKMLGRELCENEQVHHVNGDIRNNCPPNLKVVSVGEHCKLHRPVNFRQKLSNDDVEVIRKLRGRGYSLKDIGRNFDVHEATVSKICSGKRR